MQKSYISLLVWLCVTLLPGVAECAATGLRKDIHLHVGEHARTYDLYVPARAVSGGRPLVILLHGHGGNADVMTGENGKKAPYKWWLSIAEREGLLVAIPDGTIGPDQYRGWNDCRSDTKSNPGTDDVAFLRAMIEDIARTQAFDRDRLYVTGTSNGGHMTLRLAMEMPEMLAAVAPVVASMPKQSACRMTERPLSIAFMNGTEDTLNPYTGGPVGLGRQGKGERGEVLSTRDSVRWWVQHNGTNSTPEVFDYPDRSRRDRSTVHRETYRNGRSGTVVVLFEVRGGGHTEPSLREHYARLYRRIVGPQNYDIEMAEEIWAFFKDKRRRLP
jgi:polyhydroxybutyrate depolymerase